MAYGWSVRARAVLMVAATGIPAVIVVGAVTGWSSEKTGLPAWASWALAALATVIGLTFVWAATSVGRDNVTNLLLKAYRRDGFEAAEKRYSLALLSPERAGLQWFNVALALQREGDDEGADAVYRHAADCGFPPAMYNLANRLSRRGEEADAQDLYRRAAEAGFKRSDYR